MHGIGLVNLLQLSCCFQWTLARSQTWHTWTTDDDELTVHTTSGVVTGFINETAPDVRQFLSVPYASPPIGENRWLPPQALVNCSETEIDATRFPPSCPQAASRVPTLPTVDVPQLIAIRDKDDQYAKTSENCLFLAIWTPTGADQNAELPVAMFMTGGAFVTGGINIDYQLPYHWVQRTRSHIVVSINYRVNIFGFPNAEGLDSQNLGILDQRLALEWVRDNIRAFGGDPARIMLWGQSAGAISVDYHNFAFANDPIASRFFMDSGSAFLDLNSNDPTHSNFSFVAAQLGCGGVDGQSQLACMRKVDFQTIENFVGGYSDNRTLVNSSLPGLSFTPIVDEKVVFSNYTERYRLGSFSNVSALFTTTLNEGEGTAPYPKDPATMGPDQSIVDAQTLFGFTCPAANSESLRKSRGRLTYRWQFAGNFSNVSPRWWMGAYHASDLPFLFGTHQDFRQPSSHFEFATSHRMQDHLLAFMVDPVNGPAQLGWQSTASNTLLRFGANGSVVMAIAQQEVNAPCSDAGPTVSS